MMAKKESVRTVVDTEPHSHQSSQYPGGLWLSATGGECVQKNVAKEDESGTQIPCRTARRTGQHFIWKKQYGKVYVAPVDI